MARGIGRANQNVADLITTGLLLDLKTTAKPFSLPLADLFQVIGYALLDFDDEFGITRLGFFSARYGHLTTWDIETLLRTLAQREATLPALRREFRGLLLASSPDRESRPR